MDTIFQIGKKIKNFITTRRATVMRMSRSEIINSLIQRYGYKTYLEIGVNTPAQPGYDWDNIIINLKHGVDPNQKTNATFLMTSDDFFASHQLLKYDIIFIDGLHIFDQVYRDIVNSLNILNEGGTIMVHDCNPLLEKYQQPVHTSGIWLGDVWKAILKLRMNCSHISMYTINTDFGCCIIRKGTQELFRTTESFDTIYTYKFFNAHRKEILNLISVKKFKQFLLLSQ